MKRVDNPTTSEEKEELEELWESAIKNMTKQLGLELKPLQIKSCPYLLPCGVCDKTGKLCSQYL